LDFIGLDILDQAPSLGFKASGSLFIGIHINGIHPLKATQPTAPPS